MRLRIALLLVALVNPVGAAPAKRPSSPSAVGRAVLAAIDAGELAKAAEWLDDSFQLHYQGVPDAIGKREFLDLLRLNLAAFPDMRHEVAHALPSGDYVTLRVTVLATHRGEYEGVAATGRRVSAAAIHVLHFVNGKVTEWWAAEDDLGLLRQIGAVAPAAGTPGVPTFDPAEIRAAEREVIAALESSDPTAWVHMYTEDAVFVEAGGEVAGRSALMEMAKTMKPLSAVTITPERTVGHGDLAYVYCRGSWVNGRPPDAGTASRVRGLMIWRKQADGRWLIAHEMFVPEGPPK